MSTATILLVDDDPTTCELIQMIFRKLPVAVQIVQTGPDALVSIQANPPSLVLMDLILPAPWDGFHTIRMIKSNPELATIPIVVVTASDHFGLEETVYELGCEGYVPKPFDAHEFRSYVGQLLNLP